MKKENIFDMTVNIDVDSNIEDVIKQVEELERSLHKVIKVGRTDEHVKDLEAKNDDLGKIAHELQLKNEQLEKENGKLKLELDIVIGRENCDQKRAKLFQETIHRLEDESCTCPPETIHGSVKIVPKEEAIDFGNVSEITVTDSEGGLVTSIVSDDIISHNDYKTTIRLTDGTIAYKTDDGYCEFDKAMESIKENAVNYHNNGTMDMNDYTTECQENECDECEQSDVVCGEVVVAEFLKHVLRNL